MRKEVIRHLGLKLGYMQNRGDIDERTRLLIVEEITEILQQHSRIFNLQEFRELAHETTEDWKKLREQENTQQPTSEDWKNLQKAKIIKQKDT